MGLKCKDCLKGGVAAKATVYPHKILCCDRIPGAGGEGSGERCNEARQETVGVLACETEVDERQDNSSMDNVAQDWSKDVFPQTSDQ